MDRRSARRPDANCARRPASTTSTCRRAAKEFKPLADTTRLPADVATHDDDDRGKSGAVRRAGRDRDDESRHLSERRPARSDDGSGADAVRAAAGVEPPADRDPRRRLSERLVSPGRRDGRQPARPRQLTRLGEGYALFTNTLNHPTNSCNAFLAGETTMMGKEHFIEEFGVPYFTVSMGGSGGAYTSLQIADAFPGLFDGIVITATFPDALSIALAGLDAHLLTHYLRAIDAGGADRRRRRSRSSGYQGMKAFVDAANQAQRTDPVPDRADIDGLQVGASGTTRCRRRCATTRRPTRRARARRSSTPRENIYGVDPKTGFALRPFDNVGVQYGLDGAQRRRDHAAAVPRSERADRRLRSGRQLRGRRGRPAMSARSGAPTRAASRSAAAAGSRRSRCSTTAPTTTSGGYHYQWFHFAVRERMTKQNGNADNHVMWRGAGSGRDRVGGVRPVGRGCKADTSSAAAA